MFQGDPKGEHISMGRFESTNILWPPVGWNQFGAIQASTGQAVAKDIAKARIYGLHYRIDSVPLRGGALS